MIGETRKTVSAAPAAAVPCLREKWDELALRGTSIFSTPTWLETWWRYLGGDGELPAPVAVRDESSELVALVPVYAWRQMPLRMFRFLGHGPADLLGPVCSVADLPRAPTFLRCALDFLGWDLFVGDLLPGALDWSSVFEIERQEPTGSPSLHFAGASWDEVLAGMSANARQQVKRRERNLQNRFTVTYRLTDDRDSLERDLDLLFELHRMRWPRSVYSGRDAPFHRAFAKASFDKGWLRMWFLELDGVAVAAWHGYRFAGVESYYQAGWNPALSGASVGTVLLSHTIRAAAEDGMDEYRLLRGDEKYKYRWATSDSGLVSLVAGNGRAGSVAAVAASKVRRYSTAIRSKLAPVREAVSSRFGP